MFYGDINRKRVIGRIDEVPLTARIELGKVFFKYNNMIPIKIISVTTRMMVDAINNHGK